MKNLLFLLLLCVADCFAQQKEWHVRPRTNANNNYDTVGDGSYENSWSLQNALNNPGNSIQAGDKVWLHDCTYTDPITKVDYRGHFKTNINTGTATNYITIASYPGEWAAVDGNIHASPAVTIPPGSGISDVAIIEANSNFIHFLNFEISCKGIFWRFQDALCSPSPFHVYGGLLHQSATKNKFSNLVIRNIPGQGMSLWKPSVSEVDGCILYYNGRIVDRRHPNGVPIRTYCGEPIDGDNAQAYSHGVYTQNNSGETKIFKNSMFLNNYQEGIAIWSESNSDITGVPFLYDYLIEDNVFLNNNSPLADETANLLIAGNNVNNKPYEITIDNNIFYRNSTNFLTGPEIRNSSGVEMMNNHIYNGTSGFKFHGDNTKINFHDNVYAGKRIQVLATPTQFSGGSTPANAWTMPNNKYYSGSVDDFVQNDPVLSVYTSYQTFVTTYSTGSFTDFNSNYFNVGNRTVISQNTNNPNLFYVKIYKTSNATENINVDFTPYSIPATGMKYQIRDIENYFVPFSAQTYGGSTVSFPVNSPGFEMPLPATVSGVGPAYVTTPVHSNGRFGVFAIEFGCSGVDFDKTINRTDTSVTLEDKAKNNIFVGSTSYTENSGSDIKFKAGKNILLKNTIIKSGAKFLAKIENTCPDIAFLGTGKVSTTSPSNSENSKQEAVPNSFIINPNPNTGVFNVQSLTKATIIRLTITKIDNAKRIFDKDYKNLQNVDVDISNQSQGLYSIVVTFDNGESLSKTIIKQ